MSRHDYVIANDTGAAVRSDINSVLAALQSSNKGAGNPASGERVAGMLSITDDTAANTWSLKLFDGTDFIEFFRFQVSANIPLLKTASIDETSVTGANTVITISDTAITINNSALDRDFIIKGDTDTNLFRLDAGLDRIGIGTASPTTKLHVSSSSLPVYLDLTGGNGTGETEVLALRAPDRQTAGDGVFMTFRLANSGGGITYAKIIGVIQLPSPGNNRGQLKFETVDGSSFVTRMQLHRGMIVGAATGGTNGDMGAGTVNAIEYYKNGTALTQGKLLQRITGTNATRTLVTTVIPTDNTIPQVGEGTQLLTATITPSNASNIIRGTVVIKCTASDTLVALAAVFKDGAANAIEAGGEIMNGLNDSLHTFSFTFEDTAGGTSAITYTVRVGPGSSGTIYFNGDGTDAMLGGILKSYLLLEEIAA